MKAKELINVLERRAFFGENQGEQPSIQTPIKITEVTVVGRPSVEVPPGMVDWSFVSSRH